MNTNIVSISGGKDSTATALLAVESGAENVRFNPNETRECVDQFQEELSTFQVIAAAMSDTYASVNIQMLRTQKAKKFGFAPIASLERIIAGNVYIGIYEYSKTDDGIEFWSLYCVSVDHVDDDGCRSYENSIQILIDSYAKHYDEVWIDDALFSQ